MLFSRSHRSHKQTPSSFRPLLCVLEDRITPSSILDRFLPAPGPATHLAVQAPTNVKVGEPFLIAVEALDAKNHLATGYTGIVHFSLGTADVGAALPQDFKFTASNHGLRTFFVTLTTIGSQKIVATDTATSAITGSDTTTVKASSTATHFQILAPHYAVAGGPITVTVIALDNTNHVATGYNGTVSLTSTDGGASLPGNYVFKPGTDHGVHTFQVSFSAPGTPTLTATDTTTNTITGKTSVTVEAASAVTHFGVITLGVAIPGVPTNVAVVALDANNHVLAGYTGIVSFKSSDLSAALPGNYTFKASDNGRHVFSVTFNTSGVQTLTATDTVNTSITGVSDIWVLSRKLTFPLLTWGLGW